MLPDRGDISGQSTRFSITYVALRAVKETEEGNKSLCDFTQQYGNSPVTTSAVSIAFMLPGSTHAAGSR